PNYLLYLGIVAGADVLLLAVVGVVRRGPRKTPTTGSAEPKPEPASPPTPAETAPTPDAPPTGPG
ncbi:MAG TPA: hypothetical protein VGS23_09985, partial [Thermoplasmata archaeon]|nr:hypothetical protein [Thermoplasmata archaeon]